jgi:hypothetical protein
MAILRHSRIAITMEIYTQVPDKATRDALRRLSDELDERPAAGEAAADVDDELEALKAAARERLTAGAQSALLICTSSGSSS